MGCIRIRVPTFTYSRKGVSGLGGGAESPYRFENGGDSHGCYGYLSAPDQLEEDAVQTIRG